MGAYDDFRAIHGMLVDSVEVIDNNERLVFHLTGGHTATFTAYGDCCSHTWIEHITVPPDLGATPILADRDFPMPDAPDDGYSVIKVYGHAFSTPKGDIIVEYRNSSNGYYGGSLEGPEFS